MNDIALLEKERNDLAGIHDRHQHEITTIHTDYKNRHGDLEGQLNALRLENENLRNAHNHNVRSYEEKTTSVINTHTANYEN